MRVNYFLIALFFLSTVTYAQDQDQVDSLLSVLKTELSERETADVYISLARLHNNIDTIKVIDFADKALKISKDLAYTDGIADIWNIKGNVAVEIADYNRASVSFQRAYDLAKPANYFLGMSNALAGLGRIQRNLGSYDEALELFNNSLELLQQSNGKKDFVPIYNNMAMVFYYQGDYDKAIANFLKCVSIYEEQGNESGLGRLLMNTGVMYVNKGQYDTCLYYYSRALEIQKKYGQKNNIAGTLNNIGVVLKSIGNYDSALVYYRQSMKLNLELGLKGRITQNYNNIGSIYTDRGVYDSAEYYYLKSIEIYDQLNDSFNAAQTYRNLGHIYFSFGNFPKALEYYLTALRLAREIEAKSMEGEYLNAIGTVFKEQGEIDQALDYYRQSIEISTETDNMPSLAQTLSDIGKLYESLDQYDSAIIYHERSLTIHREIGSEFGKSQNYLDLAYCLYSIGQYENALEYCDSSLSISQSLDIQIKVVLGLLQKGEILTQQGKLKSALINLKSGTQLAKDIGNLSNERYGSSLLADIYEIQGDYEAAFRNQVIVTQLSDSIYNDDNRKEIAKLEAAYTYEKQKVIDDQAFEFQLNLEKEKRQKQLTILIIAVISIIIISILLALLYRRFKLISSKNQVIEEQKKQVEDQAQKLKALDVSKSNFFANISHDLRSPLTLILGSMDQVLEEGESLTIESKELLESGYRNGKKLLFMTDEIRDLARLQEGKIRLKLQLVKVVPYINLLMKMFSSAAYFKKITLQFESQVDEENIVKIDPHQFEKIIYNLLSNAVKHTPEYGDITVRLVTSDKYPNQLIIEVIDTGIGIPSDEIDHIFDRYYQAQNQLQDANAGFGIGLALCKEIADLHQSAISAAINKNGGSTFSLTLDYSNAQPTAGFVVDEYYEPVYAPIMDSLPADEKAEASSQPKDKTILIVEDHREIRHYMDNLLKNDYHTIQAKNGEEALAILKTEKVDLIISDLMMPYIDGFELLRQLKAEEHYAHIPVLIVSARTNEEDKLEILKLGAEEIIAKPFTPSEIRIRLQNLLNKTSNNDVLKLFDPSNIKSGIEQIISEKVRQLITERIDDPNLSVIDFCEVLAASERKVFRLIKKIFEVTPLELIKETRWQYLDALLKNGTQMSASEAGRSIGVTNVTYFKKQFAERYGKPYSE